MERLAVHRDVAVRPEHLHEQRAARPRRREEQQPRASGRRRRRRIARARRRVRPRRVRPQREQRRRRDEERDREQRPPRLPALVCDHRGAAGSGVCSHAIAGLPVASHVCVARAAPKCGFLHRLTDPQHFCHIFVLELATRVVAKRQEECPGGLATVHSLRRTPGCEFRGSHWRQQPPGQPSRSVGSPSFGNCSRSTNVHTLQLTSNIILFLHVVSQGNRE